MGFRSHLWTTTAVTVAGKINLGGVPLAAVTVAGKSTWVGFRSRVNLGGVPLKGGVPLNLGGFRSRTATSEKPVCLES